MRKILLATLPLVNLAALAAHATPAAVLGPVQFEVAPNEALLKQVQASLDKLNGDVKQTAEAALAQAKKAGEVSAETKAQADIQLRVQTELSQAVKTLTENLEGVTAANLEMAQNMAAGGSRGASAPVSLGRAVVEQHADAIKAYLSGGASGAMSIDVQNAITTAAGSAGGLITHEEERGAVALPRRALRISQLVTQGRTGSDLVTYRKQTLRTDATAMVAETGSYPESSFGWTKATDQVRKVGHVTNISEEAMADADQLQTELDTEMRYGLDKERDTQVLIGDGLGENLTGLVPNATAFVAAAGLADENRIDRLRLAFLQVALADYVADTVVLNPTDWAAIELIKKGASDASYVFGNPATGSAPMLWGKSVAESAAMSVGEWLAGDLLMAATLYERSGVEVLISSEHGANFVEDMLTMKVRQRLALAIKRGPAMVTGNFTFI